MSRLSSRSYEFTSILEATDIISRLRKVTHLRPKPTLFPTSKQFIGNVENGRFKLTYAIYPFGGACIFEGEVKEVGSKSQVFIQARLSKAFRVCSYLFAIPFLIIAFLLTLHFESLPDMDGFLKIIIFPIIFRIYIHVWYILIRERGMPKLEGIIHIQDGPSIR